jgi:hypothetical protein
VRWLGVDIRRGEGIIMVLLDPLEREGLEGYRRDDRR